MRSLIADLQVCITEIKVMPGREYDIEIMSKNTNGEISTAPHFTDIHKITEYISLTAAELSLDGCIISIESLGLKREIPLSKYVEKVECDTYVRLNELISELRALKELSPFL